MIQQCCMKWLLCLAHGCIPSIWALPRASAQYARDEWLAELLEASWDLHLNFVPHIRGNHLIHEKIVCDCKHFLALTNPFFFYSQYFLYKFPEDVDSVIIKVVSTLAYPCSVVSVQNIMVSFITCQPSNMEFYIVLG